VDRVACLGAVDRDVRDPVALLVQHLRHDSSSLDAGGRADRMLRPNRRVLPTRSLERARSGGLFPSMTGSRQAIPKSFCRSEVAMATLRTTKAGRWRPGTAVTST